MLLRNSIAGTRKFFQRTFENFKSFISGGYSYQRLPKTPPFSPFSCGRRPARVDTHLGHRSLDGVSRDSGGTAMKGKGGRKPAAEAEAATKHAEEEVRRHERFANRNGRRDFPWEKRDTHEGERERQMELCRRATRERRLVLVAQRLKELEMPDEEHAWDIKEVLHYYSRLTCPAFLDIVDRFFAEMFPDLFTPQMGFHSTPKQPLMKF
ncbi:hypothetical protein Nepgr_025649 [Nepenthes gracilis]|uniref:Uncharacterized protein n=1 Tax=Nepenthes gracilis TaxID=150966 RepID=A0AAD3Y1Q9_NEPGR|nr:hypothetical protein Nepgr_025649 [Nepenthes gracilis]